MDIMLYLSNLYIATREMALRNVQLLHMDQDWSISFPSSDYASFQKKKKFNNNDQVIVRKVIKVLLLLWN